MFCNFFYTLIFKNKIELSNNFQIKIIQVSIHIKFDAGGMIKFKHI